MEKGKKVNKKSNSTTKKKSTFKTKNSSLITKILLAFVCVIVVMIAIKVIPKKNNNIDNNVEKNIEEKIDYNSFLDKGIDKNTRLGMIQNTISQRQEIVSKTNEEINNLRKDLQQYDNKIYIKGSNQDNNENDNTEKINELKSKIEIKNKKISEEMDVITKLYEIYNTVLEEETSNILENIEIDKNITN